MSKQPTHRREFIRTVSVLAASALASSASASDHQRGRVSGASRAGKRLATFWCDVTPPLGTPIYSSYKPLATIEHPLLAKGVVIEDAGKRYVLCAVDWCELCNSTHTLFRQKIADAAETDISHVAVQTAHQHTAPIADGDATILLEASQNPPPHTPLSCFESAAACVADAVKQSLNGLAPFDRIGTGQGKLERVASNRRVPVGEGKVGFRGSACRDPKFREMPEGTIDPLLKTITFACGEQPLVRLHYYATHPQSFYGDPRASYDFPGIARERLQEKEHVFQIYFTGCAGNIAAGKYNDGSPPVREELAQRLYAGMEASVASTQYVRAGKVRWRTTPLLLTPREDKGFSEAEDRVKMDNASLAVSDRLGSAMGLAFRARSGRPIELSAFQMGYVHILHLPGEPMVEYQLFAQELLPSAFVAVAAYGDCGPGYICLERSFGEGGYEPSASYVVAQSETPFRDAIRALLGIKPHASSRASM